MQENDEEFIKILPLITLADGEDINKYKNLINKFISKIESLNYGVCFVEKTVSLNVRSTKQLKICFSSAAGYRSERSL